MYTSGRLTTFLPGLLLPDPSPIPSSVLCASPPCCVALPLCPLRPPSPLTHMSVCTRTLSQLDSTPLFVVASSLKGRHLSPAHLLSRPMERPHQTAKEGPLNLIRSRLARFASLPSHPSSSPALPSPAHPGPWLLFASCSVLRFFSTPPLLPPPLSQAAMPCEVPSSSGRPPSWPLPPPCSAASRRGPAPPALPLLQPSFPSPPPHAAPSSAP